MRVEVYFCQMDPISPTGKTCTFMGEVDLSNFDLLDNIPYKSYDGKINIYPYLTTIGQAKVESVYPAPTLVTDYIVLISQQDGEFQSCPSCKFDGYENLLNSFRKTFGIDKESIEKKQAQRSYDIKTKTLSQIIKDGLF